ncbi:hypothetical protein SNEBB_006153 [Seison nebaliae]|nr:hypothetical protein SNEBB_006153 [Seison nebaliae]
MSVNVDDRQRENFLSNNSSLERNLNLLRELLQEISFVEFEEYFQFIERYSNGKSIDSILHNGLQSIDQRRSKKENDEYLAPPKWTILEDSLMEFIYTKVTHYPPTHRMKELTRAIFCTDIDTEEWFRQRRIRTRKQKQNNEKLEKRIDKYLEK